MPFWTKNKHTEATGKIIIIGFSDPYDKRREIQAWVAPQAGSNLCRLTVDGHNVIDFVPDLLAQQGFTGTPILYPTPNRVRGAVFKYKTKSFHLVKNGKPRRLHGLVYDESWGNDKPVISEESVSLSTWIDFEKPGRLFDSYPFIHRLGLTFKVTHDALRISYSIDNFGKQEIPFGFGIHPYFMKLSGDTKTTVSLPAAVVMDYTSDLLPTGRVVPVRGTIFDLRRPVAVGKLNLDHVFTRIPRNTQARITYATQRIEIAMSTSSDFTHQVLFSPPGESFFCLEHQTCSTDAHNLYNRGFSVESGLRFVRSCSEHSGWVSYNISRF